MVNIAVLGGGAWGTALAKVFVDMGSRVSLWCRDTKQASSIVSERENLRYLSGVSLPRTLTVTSDLQLALLPDSLVLLAVPSNALRSTLRSVVALGDQFEYVVLSKGFEKDTMLLADEVFHEEIGFGNNFAVLSGPGFAKEIANGLPAAVSLASRDVEFGMKVVKALHNKRLRLYRSVDVTGVLVGGAVKNIVAIAAGICDGLSLGESARAAVVTRGLSEMIRFGQSCGGNSQTFQGLAGIGDLTLSCTSNLSRNRKLGLLLAKGLGIDESLKSLGLLAEGASSARELLNLSSQAKIEMPIARSVVDVMEGMSPKKVVRDLLDRAPRDEF